jgi:uncharacterized membrane protein YhaH (DUF805 family)|tara:strand:- start:33 stop:548 length:516 start_codon:yes stop_codon:yes gene_type:complete
MEIDNLDIAASIESVESGETETWNMSLYDQLTSLEGRINRLRYIGLNILALIITVVYAIVAGLVIGIIWVITGLPEFVFDFLVGLVLIPVVYITYAIIVKRLHDTGRSEGWITYAQALCILLIIWSMAPVGSTIETSLDLITTILGIPLGIVCLFFRGDAGPNQFGPDPLG